MAVKINFECSKFHIIGGYVAMPYLITFIINFFHMISKDPNNLSGILSKQIIYLILYLLQYAVP